MTIRDTLDEIKRTEKYIKETLEEQLKFDLDFVGEFNRYYSKVNATNRQVESLKNSLINLNEDLKKYKVTKAIKENKKID